MERTIKVNSNEYYKPIHDKTTEEWDKIGKRYPYNPQEDAEAKQWDNFRFSDDTYRFNVQLLQMERILDEREDQEYLTRVWRVYGKSEIGNDFEFIKQYNVDTYKIPLYQNKIVPAKGSQSLKTEAGEVTGQDIKYSLPFTIDNVLEAFLDTVPQNNLRYVTLYVNSHTGKQSRSVDKRYFLAWLLAPLEFIQEYHRTGNKALVQIDIDNIPNQFLQKTKLTEFQIEKLKNIITDSNIILLEKQAEINKENEIKEMVTKGVSTEEPKEKTITSVVKNEPPKDPKLRKQY